MKVYYKLYRYFSNCRLHCVCVVIRWLCVLFRFQNQYGGRTQTALAYAMNSEFGRVLAAQMVGAIFLHSTVFS